MEWMSSMFGNGHYSRMAVVSGDYQTLSVLPAGTVELDLTSRDLIKKAATSREIEVSDLHLDPDGQPSMEIVVPVVALAKGDRCPCVLMRIDPTTELYPLIQSWPVHAHTYECALVRREGEQVVYLNELRLTEIVPLMFRRPLAMNVVPTSRQLEAGRGMAYGEDYRGIKVTAAIERVPDSPWMLISKLDDAEINLPVRERAWLVSILVLAVILSSGIVIVLLWRRQRTLTEVSRRESENRERLLLAQRDSVFKYAHDIILIVDTSGKIVDCNDRALGAYGRERAELLGMDVAALRAPGAAPVADHFARLAETDSDFGVVYEARHAHKNGSEFPVEASLRRIPADRQALGLLAIRDITERLRAEKELSESQRKLSVLMGNLSGMAYRRRNDRAWTMDFVSEGCRELTGYGPDDLQGNRKLSFKDLIREDSRESVEGQWQAALAEHRQFQGEYPIILADGRTKWVWEQGRGILAADGSVAALEGLIVDVTDRVEAEKKFVEAAAYWETTFNALSDSVFILDMQGTILHCNESFCRLLGNTRDRIIGHKCHELIHDHDTYYPGCPFVKLLDGTPGEQLQCLINGRWCVSTVDPIRDDAGEIAGGVHVLRDITEQKTAEEALRESENRTRSIIDAVPIGMHMYRLEDDDRLVFIGANPAADHILNRDHSTLVGHTLEEAFPPLKETEVPARYRLTARSGQGWQTEQIEYHEGIIQGAFAVYAFQTSPNHVVAAFEDITERKRTEAALHAKTEELDRFFSVNLDLLCIADMNGNFRKVNHAMEATLGYSAPELEGTLFLEKVHPDDLEATQAVVARLAAGEDVVDFVNRFHCRDGSYRWIEWRSTPYSGNLIFAAARDITERLRVEDALRKSEELYRSLFDRMLNGFAYCRILRENGRPSDFVYLNVNPAFEMLTGLKDVEGKQASVAIPGIQSSDAELIATYGRVAETGIPERFETFVKALDMWFSISVYSPEPEHFVAVFDVITERKRAETALRESEERFRRVFEEGPLGMFMCGEDGRFSTVNDAFAVMVGYPTAELAGMTMADIAHPDNLADDHLSIQRLACGEIPVYRTEKRYVRKDGGVVWGATTVTVMRKPDGEFLYFLAMVDDVTERAQALEDLRASELRFRTLIEDSPAAIGIVRGGTITYGNPRCLEMFGVKSLAEIAGQSVLDWMSPQTAAEETARIQRRMQGLPVENFYEIEGLRRDGTLIPFHVAVTEVNLVDGMASIGVFTDLTARKRAEQELLNSHEQLRQLTAHIEVVREEERRWVAREVHDEIGQFLTALKMDLTWVRKRLHDDQTVLIGKTVEMVTLVDSAIQSVKKISAHMRPVPLEELGVEVALDWLIEDFEKRAGIEIRRSLLIRAADFDTERSTALFRILQESLNNVVRHSQATRVTVSLTENDNSVILFVQDNGVGIETTSIADTRSFGLIGMRERARYLGGDVSVEPGPDGGTRVIATIPITEGGKTS